MKSLTILAILVSAAIAIPAQADVIWDQSALDPFGPGQANSNSPGFGGFVIHGVQDVTITSATTIDTITQYYSTWNFDWPGAVTSGYVHVWPKTGPLPTEDASTSPLVAMTAAYGDPDVLEISATGLGIAVTPGEYWIGITPIAPAGISGANLQYSTAQVGDPVASYDLSTWDNYYPGYDGAILIEGTMPVSVEANSWSQVKNLYR
jgi:hypothetical protein